MLFNKNNLIIAGITSKKTFRPELSAVLFKTDRTVATDSYSLIEVKNPDYMQDAEFPTIEGEEVKREINEIIPRKSVLKACKNLSKVKNQALEVLQNAVLLEGEQVGLATTDLEKIYIVRTRKVDGEYPDYKQAIPSDYSEHKTVTVDVKRLKELLSILDKMDIKEKQIEFYIKDGSLPLVIKAVTVQKQEITAMLMPIKNI